ncbi:MAG: DUF1735 domain-containing protein [Alistipes sp.]
MNYTKYFKTSLFVATALFGGICLQGCADDIEIGKVDEGGYETATQVFGYVRDMQSGKAQSCIDIHNDEVAKVDLYLGLTKPANEGVDVTLKVDAEYLAAFNKKNGTSYELYPATSLVTLEESGAIVIAPGDLKSDALVVSIAKDETVLPDKVYALPIAAEMKTNGVKLSKDADRYMLFVKNVGNKPNATKGSVKTVLYFEVNDTNPLNALEFKMKESGKPFFDIIILFAANINYDDELGRVYIHNNPNVQFLLDNREQYLKPLQDQGIKVLMGILGNHDRAGVAQLADQTAREFAQELKAYCEAYNLDGVNYDDEYSDGPDGPGFVRPSSSAAARLCYETKMAMPDKICSIYAYSTLYSFSDVFDGQKPGEYVDFAVNDYGGYVRPSRFPGMTMAQCSGASLQIRYNHGIKEQGARDIKNEGYGYLMNFALDPMVYARAVGTFKNMAKGLYEEELNFTGYYYEKNSTKRKPFSEYGK